MTSSRIALEVTGLGLFPVCFNQEATLLARAVIRQSGVSPLTSLIRFGVRIEGRLETEKLREALLKLVTRHPALRSSFSENVLLFPQERQARLEAFKRTGVFEQGLFVQRVHEPAAPPIIEADWTGMHEAEQDGALLRLLQNLDSQLFNASDTLRIRMSFIRKGLDHALLILVCDHLVFDGFSEGVIRKELEYLLCGQSEREGHHGADETPLGFHSFAAWQRQTLPTPYFRRSIIFWRDQWARFARYRISFEDLSFSRPATQPLDSSFATERLYLNKEEANTLKAFARNRRSTLFTVFLAAFAIVLSDYTSRSSVVIWSHFVNRVRLGSMGSVGSFANTHILGIDLSAALTRTSFSMSVALSLWR